MKVKFVKSIGFKMAIAMALGLFAVIGTVSHFSMKSSERGLFSMAETEAMKISDVVKYSLETAMLSGDPGKIRAVMDAFGKESMVEDIKIMSTDGTIKLAKNAAEVGVKLDRNGIKSCTLCHSGNAVKKDTAHCQDHQQQAGVLFVPWRGKERARQAPNGFLHIQCRQGGFGKQMGLDLLCSCNTALGNTYQYRSFYKACQEADQHAACRYGQGRGRGPRNYQHITGA